MGIVVRPGDAVVDTAAQAGCIGITQLPDFLAVLAFYGLNVEWDHDVQISCNGIGGGAECLGTFRAPYNIMGVTGLWTVRVLKDDPSQSLPPLLPIPLIEQLGLIPDFVDNHCLINSLLSSTSSISYLPVLGYLVLS